MTTAGEEKAKTTRIAAADTTADSSSTTRMPLWRWLLVPIVLAITVAVTMRSTIVLDKFASLTTLFSRSSSTAVSNDLSPLDAPEFSTVVPSSKPVSPETKLPSMPSHQNENAASKKNSATSSKLSSDTWLDLALKYGSKVPTMQWTVMNIADEDNMLLARHDISKLMARERPVVMKKSPATKWKALKRWNPEYIARKIPELHDVLVIPDPTFFYFKERILNRPGMIDQLRQWNFLSRDPSVVPDMQKVRHVNMSTTEFFRLCSDKTPESPILYFNNDLLQCCQILTKDMLPGELVDVYHVTDQHHTRASNRGQASITIGEHQVYEILQHMPERDPEIFLWMGKDGVTASAHFDAVHNFYVQVYGKKRFVLFPPSAMNVLHIFPNIHPSSRQAQVNLSAPIAEFEDPTGRFKGLYSNLGRATFLQLARPLVVTLVPGDVLYLPPYWFHHVTAIETSISVSIWTLASPDDVGEQAENVPLPFESFWSKRKMRAAAATYIALVLNKTVDVNFLVWQQRGAKDASKLFGAGDESLIERDPLESTSDPAFQSTDFFFRDGCSAPIIIDSDIPVFADQTANLDVGRKKRRIIMDRLLRLLGTRWARYMDGYRTQKHQLRDAARAKGIQGTDTDIERLQWVVEAQRLIQVLPECACRKPLSPYIQKSKAEKTPVRQEQIVDDVLWERLNTRAERVSNMYNTLRMGECGSKDVYIFDYLEQVAVMAVDFQPEHNIDPPMEEILVEMVDSPAMELSVPWFLLAVAQQCDCSEPMAASSSFSRSRAS